MFGYVVIFNLRFIFINENRNPSTASYLVLLVVVVVVVVCFPPIQVRDLTQRHKQICS